MCGQCIEWNSSLWSASLDLRKAFDRVEYASLFEALRDQGVHDDYLSILARIYSDQNGQVRGSDMFPIERGVKQGDVISPLLFNAALELAMKK